MFERRSLKLPITLGVVMIILVVVMIVAWVLVTVLANESNSPFIWSLLAVGTLLLAMVLAGVVMYLTLSIKAINLSQRQSNFIDSVTHELKSPIASLKLCLQTMHHRPVTEEERQSILKYMLDDVERLDQLINHLLEAARTARTPRARELESVRLDQLLAECASTVCQRYHVPGDVISRELPPCVVQSAPEDLAIMFRNLLDNAVKYAGDPPRIFLRLVRGPENQAVVQIEDNGRGIPSHLRREVFGRFVRLGRELERDRPGTGLGLFIVRRLIQRTRCRIRITDGDDGRGTVFEIVLPLSVSPVWLAETEGKWSKEAKATDNQPAADVPHSAPAVPPADGSESNTENHADAEHVSSDHGRSEHA